MDSFSRMGEVKRFLGRPTLLTPPSVYRKLLDCESGTWTRTCQASAPGAFKPYSQRPFKERLGLGLSQPRSEPRPRAALSRALAGAGRGRAAPPRAGPRAPVGAGSPVLPVPGLRERTPPASPLWQIRNNKKTAVLVKEVNPKKKLFLVYRPNTGKQLKLEIHADLKKKYKKVSFYWYTALNTCFISLKLYLEGHCVYI